MTFSTLVCSKIAPYLESQKVVVQFIRISLDEMPLWQYIEHRSTGSIMVYIATGGIQIISIETCFYRISDRLLLPSQVKALGGRLSLDAIPFWKDDQS